MAKAKKGSRLCDLNPPYHNAEGESLLYAEYKNLLLNAVEITGTDGEKLPFYVEKLIKNELIECGSVGYDALTQMWSKVAGTGRDAYGNPINLKFTYRNGKTIARPAAYEPNPIGAYIIYALPDTYALCELIKDTVAMIGECESVIRQNLEASRMPYIITVKDDDVKLSIEQYIQAKAQGKPCIVVSEELGDMVTATQTPSVYIADRINELKGDYRDRLLTKLGIMSANTDKKERVQVGEVNATVGQCSDYIYLLIDTFNKQMETYDLPFIMQLNGSLEELYTGDEYADGEPTEPGQNKEDNNNE